MTLLDTHTLIWLAGAPDLLSDQAREAIRKGRRSGGLGVSAINAFELSWLAHQGRLKFTGTVRTFMDSMLALVTVQPLTSEIAVVASELPDQVPSDPVDRLMTATALILGSPLVTKNARIRSYPGIQTIW